MPGDLAQVVLQAAREEKAKENGQPPSMSGFQGSGSSSQNPSSTKQQNGHLQPPFDWRANGSRQVTSSPEPLSEAVTPSDELGHGQAVPNGLSVTPAKKRSTNRTRGRPQPSKRLHSSFFGTPESAAAKQAAKRLYTSESTQDDEPDAFHDAQNRNGSGHDSKPGHIDSSEQEQLPAGTTSTASPMRGPFSRLDSSRGESILAGHGSTTRGGSRRPSTSQPESGDDARRHSISGIAKRLGAMSETDETTDYESHDDGPFNGIQRQRQHHNDNRTTLGRMSESPERLRSANPSAPASGMNTPKRRNSGFSNPFGRSTNRRQSSGEQAAQANGHGDVSGNEKGGTGDTTVGKNKWAALRQKLRSEKKPQELEKYITGQELITDLSSGMMSIMMLKMAFDRDEHDKHRVSCTKRLLGHSYSRVPLRYLFF